MLLFHLITEHSLLWIVPCIFVSALYSWLLYRSDSRLSDMPRLVVHLLRILRFVTVFALAFFLLSPMLKYLTSTIQKPLIIFALDNTESIPLCKDSVYYRDRFYDEIKTAVKELGDDYETEILAFGDDVRATDSLNYKDKSTGFSSLFGFLQATYPNRNTGALILASDGLYNSGLNPLYLQHGLNCPLYTVMLGDTSTYKDISIIDLFYNKVAYKNSVVTVKAIIQAKKSSNNNVTAKITANGKTVAEVSRKITSGNGIEEFLFEIRPGSAGLHRYGLYVTPVEDEFTTKNNYREFVIEVVDSKQKILLLVNSPHPDAGAIKTALETNPDYEITYSVAETFKGNVSDYNLVILHQLPSKNFSASQIIQSAVNARISMLFVIGSQTSVSSFNRMETGLLINQTSQKYEETYPVYQDDFVLFRLHGETQQLLNELPPLNAPFGDYKISPGAHVLFQQKIKSVSTSKPLMLFFDNYMETKVGIICGEGIWRWRLKDYYENFSHDIFNNLINQTTQYLSLKFRKEKFMVFHKNIYRENENIQITAELYNDNFEPVNEPEALCDITNDNNIRFPFSFDRAGVFYVLNSGKFPPGEYSFSASAQLGKKKYEKSGRFVVSPINTESFQLKADLRLMEQLALRNNGKCFSKNAIMDMVKEIKKNPDINSVSFSEKKLLELIDFKIIFFIVILLLTIEWFFRKFYGTY